MSKKGYIMPKELRELRSRVNKEKGIGGFKKGHFVPKGEDSYLWKGDKVGYRGLHDWVVKQLGRPSKCNNCGNESASRYEWSNISRKYRRILNDWERLCVKCHRIKDAQATKLERLNLQ